MKNRYIRTFLMICCISLIGTAFTFAQKRTAVIDFESDVSARPDGDGDINSPDISQLELFAIGFTQINLLNNEFQRADGAPRSTFGDGCFNSSDISIAELYAIQFYPKTDADGPATENCPPPTSPSLIDTLISRNLFLVAPEIEAEDTNAAQGANVTVRILIDALGSESRYGFSLTYDTAVLDYLGTTVNGGAGATSFTCFEPNNPPGGTINCQISGFPNTGGGPLGNTTAGDDQYLVGFNFMVLANATQGSMTPLTLTGVSVSDDFAQPVNMNINNGVFSVDNPTAAAVEVSGKVMTSGGRGLYRAVVTYTNAAGNRQIARTNQFGYFRFPEVEAGNVYVFNVDSKLYTFEPQVVNVNDSISGLNFIAVD